MERLAVISQAVVDMVNIDIIGHVNGNDKEVTGKIEIPNLSEEHDDLEDVDVDITLTTKGAEADALKEMLRKGDGAKDIRKALSNYVSALKNEYSTDLIKPKKGQELSRIILKR